MDCSIASSTAPKAADKGMMPEWGVTPNFRVRTKLSHFAAYSDDDGAPVEAEPNGSGRVSKADGSELARLAILHVPLGVQTACDPAIFEFGKTLGVNPSTDLDPVWDFGHTGVQLWSSAVFLGDFLLTRAGRALVSGKRVLELGCGVGLLGPILALAGAKDILLTDVDPLALSLCRHNVALNEAASVLVRALDWRKKEALEDVVCDADAVDVVLATDLVYEEGVGSNLRQVLVWLTDRYPQCSVLVAMKYRTEFGYGTSGPEASQVGRWLSSTCGADVVHNGPQNHRDREASRSPRRSRSRNRKEAEAPGGAEKKRADGEAETCCVPSFSAELLSARRGSSFGEHLRSLQDGSQDGVADHIGSDKQRLEVWRLRRRRD